MLVSEMGWRSSLLVVMHNPNPDQLEIDLNILIRIDIDI